ncbi:YdeI/OmpD-associated family protein [Paractinoplanes hotanensis]|uniref:YdeI/OmpD-associated family protein n=1 Tax=Paractinoplanes hotanensis TaxID=2906497 RepID=A0ABT0Y2X2_9ACTN|nr:YdeI/OmpD-associated family protein [Actinoplanes hotanensis]MCM4080392.1 YdeI/OmpD-associated family protein [Actinoplanes hotanensis]
MAAEFFDTPSELRAWFEQHHETAPELFVGYWKKGSGRTGITHPQAIEQALCFGWIDSVGRTIDDRRYQVRFTPRRKGSVWSAINVAKIAELTEAGLMHPAGRRAFEQRKPDRVAVYSYEQPADAVLDDSQTARFLADDAAWQWFSAQSPSYRRAAVHWVVSAKRADTRERRLAQLIADSAAGRKVPPLTPR